MQAGGKTVGYSWLKLDNDLDTNRFLGVVTHFPEMEQRLARVVGDAAICVFFPGRTGTVAELALATEMRAKGEKRFPLVLVGDFWNGFFSWLEKSNASLDVPSDEDDLKDILYVRIDDAEAFDRFLEKHRAVLELAE
uniref:AMP nucleosidase n=1 Tax=Candidatus Kentrum sp. DK TaxID=2126562 RepID=A0A450SR46_9GAMM|nr:MAG: Possible lysine decarboxylase [Candidatus Kentron sp. DK]